MSTLLATTFVITREGLEAWLIAVLAMATAGTNVKQIRTIWMAVIVAIIATLILGSATAQILGNHANIERFEAVISLFTAVVLAYVAWFCHGASQHLKQLPTHNYWLLGLAVFGIMFREGVEVVLFITGIMLKASSANMVILGILAGMVILAMTVLVSQKHIKRLPIKTIFRFSRYIFAVMAVYFAYSGITELLEYFF